MPNVSIVYAGSRNDSSRSGPAPLPAASRHCEISRMCRSSPATFIRIPSICSTLATSTPISAHVAVDFELRGCPIDKGQLLEVIKAFLVGRKPAIAGHSVCVECKARGNPCVMVAHKTPCLGPVTHAGCGAICPSYNRGCYGCFGPVDGANTAAIAREFSRLGMARTRYRAAVPDLQRRRRGVPQGGGSAWRLGR